MKHQLAEQGTQYCDVHQAIKFLVFISPLSLVERVAENCVYSLFVSIKDLYEYHLPVSSFPSMLFHLTFVISIFSLLLSRLLSI